MEPCLSKPVLRSISELPYKVMPSTSDFRSQIEQGLGSVKQTLLSVNQQEKQDKLYALNQELYQKIDRYTQFRDSRINKIAELTKYLPEELVAVDLYKGQKQTSLTNLKMLEIGDYSKNNNSKVVLVQERSVITNNVTMFQTV